MELGHELQNRIARYLDQISLHLVDIPGDERQDILSSVESHIYDALSKRTENEPTCEDLDAVLAEMDHPDTYATLSSESSSEPARRMPNPVRLVTYVLAIVVLPLAGFQVYRLLAPGSPVTMRMFRFSSIDFPNPQMYSSNIVVDLYHGFIQPEVRLALEADGFTILKSDAPLTRHTLEAAGTLWVSGTSTQAYRPSELDVIQGFVMSGGTLICSEQVWSWAQQDKDIGKHPMNQIGARFGFVVTGQNIGSPDTIEMSEYLRDVDGIERIDWWPSKVDVSATEFYPLIRDESVNTMAVYMPYGKGRIFVFGHPWLLRDNPMVVLSILRSICLAPQDEQ